MEALPPTGSTGLYFGLYWALMGAYRRAGTTEA